MRAKGTEASPSDPRRAAGPGLPGCSVFRSSSFRSGGEDLAQVPRALMSGCAGREGQGCGAEREA